MEQMNQAYKVFTRICLNNWHYIDRKVLGLNESINFFTGHSGSGKSTVIDAMQIVLYANTDGRGFFNKAAADDSDRSLIEYLRGMINIGENNQAEYKRNKNFSTTIVLEMEQTITKEKECIGVVFDVETATNEINRLFFWLSFIPATAKYSVRNSKCLSQKSYMRSGIMRPYFLSYFRSGRNVWESNVLITSCIRSTSCVFNSS
jgi:predicted ATPase